MVQIAQRQPGGFGSVGYKFGSRRLLRPFEEELQLLQRLRALLPAGAAASLCALAPVKATFRTQDTRLDPSYRGASNFSPFFFFFCAL